MDVSTAVRFAPVTIPEARNAAKQAEFTLDALKVAIETGGEHRLFRWGKLAGLFPHRTGDSSVAATHAVHDGLLEIVRTETRGKLVIEWVKATPKAVAYVDDHDSPKAVLRELRGVLGATITAIPDWMTSAKDEATLLATRFEHRAVEMLEKLEKLSERVEAAIRRAEAGRPTLTLAMQDLVPWGVAALEYLDRRQESFMGDCPLPDLFHAMDVRFPTLTMTQFQNGLKRLHDTRAVKLIASDHIPEPEYAFIVENEMKWFVRR